LDRPMSNAERAQKQRRQLRLAERVLRQYGMGSGSHLTVLRERNYKKLFRVVSPSHGAFALHMHRTAGIDEGALHSPEGLLSRRGRNTEAALRSQLLWIMALSREAGVLVPEPVPTLEGALTSRASDGKGRDVRRCYLLRWAPGQIKIQDLELSDLRMAGLYMARLHSHAEGFSVPDGFLRPERGWEFVFGDAEPLWDKGRNFYSSDEMEVFHAAAERVESHLKSLEKSKEVFGIIHGDLHRRNLVFHEDSSGNKTVCALDFDHCGWGYYLYDLAVTVRYLQAYGEDAAPMCDAFLEGYQRERPLRGGPEHLAACQVMRLVELVNLTLVRREDAIVAKRRDKLRDRPFYNKLVAAPLKLRGYLKGDLSSVW
jgi:Ser/Thr protein kinase RdoA (MazF antagonist)